MRIVHSESSCGWGGQEIRILSEAQGMLARGHDVSLVCPEEARIYTEAPRFGVPVTALPIANKAISGVLAMRAYLRAEQPFQVINCHSSTDSWLAALALLGSSTRPALVRTRHVSAPVPNNFTSRWLYQRASEMVVTTGAALRDQLIADNGLAATRVVSIPTGIDLTRYRPPRPLERQQSRLALGLDPDCFVVGIVATLRSWKGHRFLIDALAPLLHQLGARGGRLLIVGDGPQQGALAAQIAAANLETLVNMCGSQHDVVPYLHALDAFALPSYANEGVPQALLQAMACAVPVVTTDAGAIGEIAIEGDTAKVVPRQDAIALANALFQIAQDQSGAAARAERALALVTEHHSIKTMLDRMTGVFEAAAARP